jgi:hypothetical protein
MNLYKTKENYNGYETFSSIWNTLIYLFFSISTIAAIYYSFVIEKGFSLGPFLLALFFSPIYLVWGIYKVGLPPN